MKLEKLARILVDEDFEGCPGDEHHVIAVERKTKELRDRIIRNDGPMGQAYVYVEVEE